MHCFCGNLLYCSESNLSSGRAHKVYRRWRIDKVYTVALLVVGGSERNFVPPLPWHDSRVSRSSGTLTVAHRKPTNPASARAFTVLRRLRQCAGDDVCRTLASPNTEQNKATNGQKTKQYRRMFLRRDRGAPNASGAPRLMRSTLFVTQSWVAQKLTYEKI